MGNFARRFPIIPLICVTFSCCKVTSLSPSATNMLLAAHAPSHFHEATRRRQKMLSGPIEASAERGGREGERRERGGRERRERGRESEL